MASLVAQPYRLDHMFYAWHPHHSEEQQALYSNDRPVVVIHAVIDVVMVAREMAACSITDDAYRRTHPQTAVMLFVVKMLRMRSFNPDDLHLSVAP
ncbi:hypothetical protein ISP15_11875 [Dyella jejuensis]|uniref:Uncharacterized protein n=1 Tax=Dyella jejuensis TaxID=1432009 RepID=A0ABW8JIV1_9GAMM